LSNVVLYIASSIDGYIAKVDNNLDWLESIPNPSSGDYGYQHLIDSVHAIIMGRKTYDKLLSMDIEWPYANLQCLVVSNKTDSVASTPNTVFVADNFIKHINDLKKRSNKYIWLVGGGQLIASFLKYGLIDKMILTIIPITLGNGIPLFPSDTYLETNWKLVSAQTFDTGIVNLTYYKQ
jgi:dihydrofolate reductase